MLYHAPLYRSLAKQQEIDPPSFEEPIASYILEWLSGMRIGGIEPSLRSLSYFTGMAYRHSTSYYVACAREIPVASREHYGT